MPQASPTDDPILIPACLAPGEAADHRNRLMALVSGKEAGSPALVEITEVEGRGFPSAISLQLCLAVVADLRALGARLQLGVEAQRLLGAQKLL